jgi:hypothetical protein
MRYRSESKALIELTRIRQCLRASVEPYETKATDCGVCDTRGACCQDEHFVNVRVTHLEATAIRNAVDLMPTEIQNAVYQRATVAVQKLQPKLEAAARHQTYSCPLYHPELQCLVHDTAKPSACIVHACYEKREDLPPDDILESAEASAAELNLRVYGRLRASMPIPVAILSRRNVSDGST